LLLLLLLILSCKHHSPFIYKNKSSVALMDVVLEVFDTFLFDKLYAAALPAVPSFSAQKLAPNATFANVGRLPAVTYSYEPASRFMSFEPSEFAYMSQWSRNNVFRQGVSLFLITW